ncbi:MAG: AAA family ATPase [Bacteroidales bacterium]|nr:AAA family ATPase [Bacteroidales bacterium]
MDSKKTAITLLRDTDAEALVLGTILSSPQQLAQVRDILTPECFYDPRHQEIFEAIKAVDNKGEDVNLITVSAALAKAGAATGMDELVSISQQYTLGEVDSYAYRLKELDMRRKLWELGQTLVQQGSTETDDLEEVYESARAKLTGIFASATVRTSTLSEVFVTLRQQIQRNRENTAQCFGTPTGFRHIDAKGGLVPTDFIVVAGETSNGKTAFATALAVSAIKAAHPIAFYSMEMSNIQLAARIAAMMSGVGSREMLQDRLDDSRLRAVDKTIGSLPSHLCFFDDDATSSFDKIAASIRTMVLRHGIKGAIIDYLQILNVNMKSANKEQVMGEVSRRLKNLAKELNIWIIALSQLSRDRDNPRPNLNRLRDSGQIGEAADQIMLVWRPEVSQVRTSYPEPFRDVSTHGTAMIDVAKGRNTGIYSFICGFNADTTCFYDIPSRELPSRNEQPPANPVADMQTPF